MALTDGLVEYWPLNEASGDALGAHASKTFSDYHTVGSGTGHMYAAARDFEETSTEYFSRARDTDIGGGADFTFACWWNMESSPGSGSDYHMVFTSIYAATGWSLGFVNNGILQAFLQIGASTIYTAHTDPDGFDYNLGEWHLVIGWYDHSEATCYIVIDDDQALGSATGTAGAAMGDGCAIGARWWGDATCWDGLLQGAAYWNRILSETERAAVWNGGAGLTYAQLTAPPVTRRRMAPQEAGFAIY